MAKTFLDELVEYPAQTLRKIGTTKSIVSLLVDDAYVDMDGEEADSVFDKYLFDYGYVDETTLGAYAYICVEAELMKVPTPTMQDWRLYVTVVCHKKFMQINNAEFHGMIGNRRDNIVREIDKLLNGSDALGIGMLSLDSVKTISSPAGFTARELTYSISDFKNKGVTVMQTPVNKLYKSSDAGKIIVVGPNGSIEAKNLDDVIDTWSGGSY